MNLPKWLLTIATLALVISVGLKIATIFELSAPTSQASELVIGSWSQFQPSPWKPNTPWIGPLTNNRLLETLIVDWEKVDEVNR
jgi:hypothetical protein